MSFDLSKYTSDELEQLFDKCGFDRLTRRIIVSRFGIGTGIMRTLDEVGELYEITREQVRNIEARAMSVIRREMTSESN